MPGEPEEAIDAARLPIPRIAGVDEDDRMEIAREPDCAACSPAGPPPIDRHVEGASPWLRRQGKIRARTIERRLGHA